MVLGKYLNGVHVSVRKIMNDLEMKKVIFNLSSNDLSLFKAQMQRILLELLERTKEKNET